MTPTKLQHHHHHHAPFIHDLGLMHLLTYIWLGIVIAGLVLNSGIEFINENSYWPTFSSSFAPQRLTDSGEWKHLESHGDVELMYQAIVPTSGLHAHRAVVVADLPIEALLHVFRDTPNSVKWAKDLKEAEEYHKSGAHHVRGNAQLQTSTVRQRFNVPIPGFKDREYVMTKKMDAIEGTEGSHFYVKYAYTSLSEEESKAAGIDDVCTGCVRATNLGTKWTFTTQGKDQTKIELEVATDPKMASLSSFFVNRFQKNWPVFTLHGLMKETRRHLGRESDVDVTNTFFRLFPIWV